ncbi:MAG: CPBP family intramembrane metalloprotease [Alicyclobacillus sp.]|nr:CPBP family intramembrane metalloprotease [Alicyclobacillus sp.]
MSLSMVFLSLVLLYLVLGQPWLGRRLYQRLKAGQQSRLDVYRITMLVEWGLALFVVLVYLLGGIPLRLLGLYNPNGFSWPPGSIGSMLAGFCVALCVGVLGSGLVLWLRNRRGSAPARRSRRRHGVRAGEFDALLPRSLSEKWAFAGVAVTAGICEEILFRGMAVYVLNRQFSSLGPILTVVITALIFAIAHLYQGWTGMLAAGVIGVVFAFIYLSTGALWLPIFLHALVDLRALFVAQPVQPEPQPTND